MCEKNRGKEGAMSRRPKKPAAPVREEQQPAAAVPTASKRPHNSNAVVLNADEICAQLGISRRTLDRRLRGGWNEGHWFFKQKGRWHIRESHLEELISWMEYGKI